MDHVTEPVEETKKRKKYFISNKKTEEEIKTEREKRIISHRNKMRDHYKKKKINSNNTIKKKFDEIYSKLNGLGGYTDIKEVDDKKNTSSHNRYTCLCFDKLYEAYEDINKPKN